MIKLMFLGDRRIAWEVLQLLQSDPFRDFFQVPVLVTGERLEQRYREIVDIAPIVLRNDGRHTARLAGLLDEREIDCILSIQHNWVLPEPLIEAVDGKALNLHNGNIGKYKGYNAISYAILNGDRYHNPTLHWMAAEVDCGPVAYEGSVEVRSDDSALSLYPRTVSESVRIVSVAMEALKNGVLVRPDASNVSQGAFYEREDLLRLADVTGVKDPVELDRRIRALFFPPLNAAYKVYNGSRIYLMPEGELTRSHRSLGPINEVL